MFSSKIGRKPKNKSTPDFQPIISEYKLKNNRLLFQIEDLKTTLNLNQEILYNFIENVLGKNESIQKLINQSKTLWEKNQSLIDTKFNQEIKIDELQKLMEKASMNIRDEVNIIISNLNKKRSELSQKDIAIKKLKSDLDKARKSAFFKTARTEIYVSEPTKSSVDLNQELLNAKIILNKATKQHSKEKKNSDNMKKKANELREKMNKLKKEAVNIFNTKKNGTRQTINSYLKDMNYNEIMETDDQEFEEEENEESEESSDDESEGNKKNNKAKEKEFNSLNEQYNRIKSEIDTYQNKINHYKKIYKKLKDNIKENVK